MNVHQALGNRFIAMDEKTGVITQELGSRRASFWMKRVVSVQADSTGFKIFAEFESAGNIHLFRTWTGLNEPAKSWVSVMNPHVYLIAEE
jgi:hypothetical protein